jgi:protein-tyrosine phosphatase
MVTNDVAIGNYRASYAPFDIIVNLNYPRNHMEKDKVVTEKVFGEKTSHVITCGFSDDEHGLTKEKITDLLKRIRHIKKDGDKILFHCYAGISRSTTVAIAYLSGELQHSPQQIYQMILQKRPRIDPNYHFRKAIGIDYA